MKFLTFGEIMLRLKAPGQECFFQSPMLEATFGGGEANVAVSLANYGEDAAFLTVLPDNAIADACKAELRRFDVDTKRIVTGEGRMGIYYLEGGANQRPSKVVYDRAYSAIALAKPGDIDWDKAFDGVEWFHITGITPAISESAMELSVESVKAVSDVICPVSGTICEVNEALADAPETLNSDPYGAWIIKVSPVTDTEALLDAAAYEAHCAQEG